MWEHYCQEEKTIMSVGDGEPCNWCEKENKMTKDDRGWSRESHEQYMARRKQEEDLLQGNFEYEYGKATDKQVGGSHYKDCVIQPTEYIMKNNLKDYLDITKIHEYTDKRAQQISVEEFVNLFKKIYI